LFIEEVLYEKNCKNYQFVTLVAVDKTISCEMQQATAQSHVTLFM
jgi:hypothetical protein